MVSITASASGSRPPATPSADSLAFSAQLYTSQISSWIPSDFGVNVAKPSTSSTSDLFTETDRGDRLGIGHPSLDIPKHKRHENKQLERLLGMGAKGKGKTVEGVGLGKQDQEEVDEDEEGESRAKIVKKRKVGTFDLLAGKKKGKGKEKEKVNPLAIRNVVRTDQDSRTTIADTPLPASIPTTSGTEQEIVRPTSPVERVEDESKSANGSFSIPPGTSLLTKNQRKKMRKKQKKLAGQAEV